MNRIDIINSLIKKNNYKSYLEVGVQAGHCFNAINCEYKAGVDPDKSSAATFHQSSDEFFNDLKNNPNWKDVTTGQQFKFDICFSDGLHHADQSERDINNMIDCLNDGGAIVCHDMLPTSKRMQEIPLQEQVEWTGDVWRSWLKLRSTRADLSMYCINTDWGTSIIKKGSQQLITLPKPVEEITYEDWNANKQEWMNIISVEEFSKLFLQ